MTTDVNYCGECGVPQNKKTPSPTKNNLLSGTKTKKCIACDNVMATDDNYCGECGVDQKIPSLKKTPSPKKDDFLASIQKGKPLKKTKKTPSPKKNDFLASIQKGKPLKKTNASQRVVEPKSVFEKMLAARRQNIKSPSHSSSRESDADWD
jgi:ribosomal protein S27AE